MLIIPALLLPASLTLALLLTACGPGTTTTTDDPSTTTPATTTDPSTSTADTATDTTTDTPTTTTGPPDTSMATTTQTDATTTDPTTGNAACEAIVGSQDCPALVAVSGELTLEECNACQGAACGSDPTCDGQYPCVDNQIVLQGCCTDEQCAGLTPYCGMFIAPNNVCVFSDDV